jgi:putative hemolysin
MATKIGVLCSCLLSTLLITGPTACSGNSEQAASPRPEARSQANPAAVKCLTDGFQLEPVLKNGVPSGSLCKNPGTGKKCEVWKYYRQECRLD